MKMKNIIKKQQKTIFIGFMSVALFIICICTVCTAYAADKDNAKTPVDIPGLTYDHSMELSYAEEFSVDYYNDGYALITIDQEGQFHVAEKAFKEQTDKLDKVLTSDDKDTGKTVAFFYINSTGAVNVRKNGDYVSNMIELAGGKYVPEDTGESDNALSTMNMQMEEFYAKAKDADYIIYNSTIDGELSTIDELLAKSNLLADFKAVKDGNVWCTGKNLFQETTELGTMIEDIHTILTTDDDSLDELAYMHKLK